MKPLKIAALGFAGVLAVLVAALAFGVPALTKLAQDQVEGAALAFGVPALTKLAQDQVEGHSTYRFRVDGPTTLSFRPSPTLTLRKVNLVDVSGNPMAPSITAERVRVSLSLASLVSGRPEVNELAVMKPNVRAPLVRQGERRGGGSTARAGNDSAPAAATPAFTLDRFIVEDGTVVMSNTQDRFEFANRSHQSHGIAVGGRWPHRYPRLCGRSADPPSGEGQDAARSLKRPQCADRILVRGAGDAGGHHHRHR